jgi:hypothetical protein
LAEANPLLDVLRRHHNTMEKHREIRCTPQAAWNLAKKESRWALRPAPACPWWPLRLQPAHPHPGRRRWAGSGRNPTPLGGRAAPEQSHPLPAPQRRRHRSSAGAGPGKNAGRPPQHPSLLVIYNKCNFDRTQKCNFECTTTGW